MEGLKVRMLGPDDIMDVHALWKEASVSFRPAGRDSISQLTREMTSGNLFIAGAFLGEAFLGLALGSDDGRKGWISRLAVKPGYRRQGVAHSLVAFCEQVFKGRGRGIACSLVEGDNETALALFESAGFELRKDMVYFSKPLGPEE
jgi:ribosomal protein S18 acetylase RimI-like enzyme